MKTPRVVLFDLGNVLVQLHPERFWVSLGESDPSRHTRFGEDVRAMGRGYESGAMTTEEFWSEMMRQVGPGYSHHAVKKAFCDVLPEPVFGMESVVRATSAKAATVLVSNTSPVHFQHCLRTVPCLRHLQRFYVSYQMRVLKPDPAFYRMVIEGEQCDPEAMVFIDDLAENVEGARRAGMQGIVFKDAEQLKRVLEEFDL
jgi:HAD superfamily hydrolase (TIGR01509 family)